MAKSGTLAYKQQSNLQRRSSFESLESTSVDSVRSPVKRSDSAAHEEETLAQKKQRLFKWNHFQNVKISLDVVKQQLLKNTNFIRFVSLFENFDQVAMSWGSNKWYQQGIYIQKDFKSYYKNDYNRPLPQEGDADMAYRELAQVNSQSEIGSDQILMFQTLLQKWQEQLNTNWSVNFEFLKLQQMKKCKYELKTEMYDPTILLSMLNS